MKKFSGRKVKKSSSRKFPLVDANLLLLFVIGSVNSGHFIQSSKRLRSFSYKDYKLLIDVIQRMGGFATTSYILTEVSNLIDLYGDAANEAFKTLQLVSHEAEIIPVSPQVDTNHEYFTSYGLTDANILGIALTRPILTNDERLSRLASVTCPEENIIPWCLIKDKRNFS